MNWRHELVDFLKFAVVLVLALTIWSPMNLIGTFNFVVFGIHFNWFAMMVGLGTFIMSMDVEGSIAHKIGQLIGKAVIAPFYPFVAIARAIFSTSRETSN